MIFCISKLWSLFAVLATDLFVTGNETRAQFLYFSNRKASFPAELFPVCLHFSLHSLRHDPGLISRQPEARNFTQSVTQRRATSVGSNAYGKIPLQRNLREWNDIVAGRQSPSLAVPQKAVISEMVVVVVDKNVEYHPLPQLPRIFSR